MLPPHEHSTTTDGDLPTTPVRGQSPETPASTGGTHSRDLGFFAVDSASIFAGGRPFSYSNRCDCHGAVIGGERGAAAGRRFFTNMQLSL